MPKHTDRHPDGTRKILKSNGQIVGKPLGEDVSLNPGGVFDKAPPKKRGRKPAVAVEINGQAVEVEEGSLAAGADMRVVISPPKIATTLICIRGISPYVQNRFSQKAQGIMETTQAEGSVSKKGRKREPKDFDECYEMAMHRSEENWLGIPAPAFRNAAVDACRLVGFKMTHAKLGIFIVADGFDCIDGTPLVRIIKGEPKQVRHAVRNESGVADIRARPMWDAGWVANVIVKFDLDMFKPSDVHNLMLRVGLQVGIGEGRPNSKKSSGLGWGLFEVIEPE